MADTTSLSQFLTDVADAIRTKTGSSDAIAAASFDTEITNIPTTSVNNQDKSVTTSTEAQTITADDGYTGLGTVSVSAVDATIDSNIVAANIVSGVTILGVEGTAENATTLLAGSY